MKKNNSPAGGSRGSRPYGSDRVEKSEPSPVDSLKTLKDISIQYKENMGNKIVEDTAKWMEFDIKAEAVKWVKEYQRMLEDYDPEAMSEYSYADTLTHAFTKFFNLTEEDLK